MQRMAFNVGTMICKVAQFSGLMGYHDSQRVFQSVQ